MNTSVFQAMGGDVELQYPGDPAAARRIRALFAEHEQRLSRFLPWSELCALNASGGAGFAASEILFGAVGRALAWAHATRGVFDPTVIDTLEATGYDRPFDEVPGQTTRWRSASTDFCVAPSWASIALDAPARTITLPSGVRIDLGGIGKGFTVDRAIAGLGPSPNAMINAAGDLYAAGGGPYGDGWTVAVEDPFDPARDIATLRVRDRGVATSGANRRHWTFGDRRYHHLVDARTRACAQSDLIAVTVVAPTATAADVFAKTVFVLGAHRGLAMAERIAGVAVLAVRHDRTIVRSGNMKEFELWPTSSGTSPALPASRPMACSSCPSPSAS